jgi:hypothetical protein
MSVRNILCGTFISACAVVTTANMFAAPGSKSFKHPVVFEPNQGQLAPEIQWMARASGYQMLITADSATFVLVEAAGQPLQKNSTQLSPEAARSVAANARETVLRMKLAGSHGWNANGVEPTGGVSNYFVGNDPKHWHSNIPHYGQVRIAGVYPGVDLLFYDNKGDLEYDFIVSPGADPKRIRLAFEGADHISLDEREGDLRVKTATGAEFRTHRPKVFQERGSRRVEIAGGYDIVGEEAVFKLASYNVKHPLVIDPAVTFTTFLQGGAEDIATGIAVDGAGNSYVSGWTFSSDFASTTGSPLKGCKPVTRPNTLCLPAAFVAKLSPTGTVLFFTYLSGSDLDMAAAIAADATGAYVTGITFSPEFPAYFTSYKRGGGDVFVTKLSPTGSLVYSSVFGGTNVDDASGIAVDATQSVYITGKTKSVDYPISTVSFPGLPPMQKLYGGGIDDAFVTKLDSRGLLYDGYSTYLGGADSDEAADIAIDASGFAYVTGITFSINFPKVGPSFGTPRGNGTSTAFVTKLVPGGSGALYSLTLGGGADEGNAIAVGANGNAYITGDTASAAFPTTASAFQINKPSPQILNGFANFDGFVAEISPGGLLLFATYLGGTNGATFGRSIRLNNIGEVYVAGSTATTDFPGPSPITPNPTAGFLVKFPPNLNALSFRIYLGAQINNIAITRTSSRFLSSALTPTYIYTTGFRWKPGTNVSDPMNIDGFVVKVEDGPVLTQLNFN